MQADFAYCPITAHSGYKNSKNTVKNGVMYMLQKELQNTSHSILETLVCLPMIAILTMLLLKVCLSTMQPMITKIEEYQTQQEQQVELLEEVLNYD